MIVARVDVSRCRDSALDTGTSRVRVGSSAVRCGVSTTRTEVAVTVEDLRAGPWRSQPWSFPLAGDARFTWEYDVERQRMLALYQKGKDKQWDAQKRIDWELDLDEQNPLGMPVEVVPILGVPEFEKRLDEPGELTRVRRSLQRMQISQFLHG